MKQYQIVELSFEKHIALADEVDVDLQAVFVCGRERVKVKGFYAGNDTFKVRFLPMQADGFHVRYTDGTMFTPFGTTVYALAHQTRCGM